MQNLSADQLQQIINIITFLAVVVAALGTSGMVGMVLVIRQNKAQAEMIWQSIPIQTQQIIRPIIQGGRQLFEAVDDIIDAPATTTTTTTVTATPIEATDAVKG